MPASTLTDNGMVFTTRLSGGKRRPQRLRDRTPPPRRGPEELPAQPPHHLRQGRTVPADDEEVAARPTRPTDHARRAPGPLDAFVEEYNHHRPHRSLPHRATPATVYTTRPKATAGDRDQRHPRPGPPRPRRQAGKITLRYHGRLYSIGIGRTHARTRVLVLVQDLDIRIINAATGELLRELVLDPTKRYQGTGRPPGPTPKNKNGRTHNRGFGVSDVLRHHMVGLAVCWFRTSETHVSRHRKPVSRDIPETRWPVSVGDVQSQTGDHRCGRRGPTRPRSPPATASPRPGSTSSWPATEPRARPRSSPARGGRRRSPTATAAEASS